MRQIFRMNKLFQKALYDWVIWNWVVSGRMNPEIGRDGMSFRLNSCPMYDDLFQPTATIWLFLIKQNGRRRLRQITGGPINEQKISQLARWLGPCNRVSPEFPTICNGTLLRQKPSHCFNGVWCTSQFVRDVKTFWWFFGNCFMKKSTLALQCTQINTITPYERRDLLGKNCRTGIFCQI